MKRVIVTSIFLCGLIAFLGPHVFGKEWNAEQKEIIKLSEARDSMKTKGDLEGTMAGFHNNALIWGTSDKFPIGKDLMKFKYGGWFRSNKPKTQKTEILDIQIVGNVAIIYSMFEWEGENRPGIRKGRSIKMMVKVGNEWKLMGAMSASCDKPVPCPQN